ncbi:mitochondrial import inner membrane translocase subunit TIM16 [Tritrichomonas musculus]|uniref:Mitochondrial import inner membrane translocase subunit TIM16 n=1 Tax=Tritrichomonas musculus TaxID=1915356 RepID=A0ABR2L245_9EUKA
MVLVEITGLVYSSTKVFFRSVSNAIKQTVALNAPNGNIFQKIGACLFGLESTTQMLPNEALQILGFENETNPPPSEVKNHLEKMLKLNDLSKGGSPYLQERFIAASHILSRNYKVE